MPHLIAAPDYSAILYGFRLKGVENTWKSEGSEKEKNGFRTWSVEIGAVPISTRDKRNPYYTDSVCLVNKLGNAILPIPRLEPVLLILALLRSFASPLECSWFLQTIQSESVLHALVASLAVSRNSHFSAERVAAAVPAVGRGPG
ncbi:hypothetical protein [Deinococcus saxicola]|uniref:hypothetical protein n=1 Tax=Deinococcus saxicola TaxID=249406 RepID=UPI0039EF671D